MNNTIQFILPQNLEWRWVVIAISICCRESKGATARYTPRMLNFLAQKMLFKANEITLSSCDTMAGKLIKLFDGSETYMSRPIFGTAHAQNWRISVMAVMAWGCRLTYVLQFLNDIWQELWINICWNDLAGIQSELKWNCYLTSKKFALTEMAIELEPFWHHGPNHHDTYGSDCQRRACLLA